MTKGNVDPVVVIGAGIVGLSTAIWLRRAGKDVVVIDRDEPGMGTSYGNAGIIAACSVVPVVAPGLVKNSPKYLLDPNFPLFMRWSYLPRLAPWLIKFLGNANDRDTRRIAKGLATIVGDSPDQHMSLVRGTSAENWITSSDYCFGYKDRRAFDADPYTWEVRAEAGFVPELLAGDEVRDYDPNIGPAIDLLAVMKDHAFVRAPGRYVQALVEVLKAEGGSFRQADVTDVELTDGRISAVVTKAGRIACETAVLSTGPWSKPLARKLGLDVPLEAERGYHIVLKNPSFNLRAPVMIAAGKFVATPMEDGLRCAGVVEFGGLDAGPSKAPIKLLLKYVRESFPTLEYSEFEDWLGFRPTTIDCLPVIGEIAGTGVYAGFGHNHIGLTSGPKTGRLIADLITQKGTNTDLSAYDPGRFN